MTMPFGVHKGLPLEDLPDSYIEWLSGIDLRSPLSGAVQKEARRRRSNCADQVDSNHNRFLTLHMQPADAPFFREIIDAGYRVLARKVHPDTGGSAAQMQSLNSLVSSLRQQVSGPGLLRAAPKQ